MERTPSRLRLSGVVLPAILLAGCEGGGVPLPDPIRAGFSEEPPYAFVSDDGTVTGEGPETLRKTAAALGLSEPEWVRLPFDEILPALHAGRIDVAASGHLATPERAREVAFTLPTTCPDPALLVSSEAAGRVHSLVDLVESDHLSLVVLGGSIEEAAAARLGIPAERVLVVYDVRSAAVALRTGRSHAFAITLPTARWVADSLEGEGLEVVGPYPPPPMVSDLLEGCSALVLRPGDRNLLEALNGALPQVLADEGHRARLKALGFDSVPFADPPDPEP